MAQVTYSSTISACARATQWETALCLFQEAQQHSISDILSKDSFEVNVSYIRGSSEPSSKISWVGAFFRAWAGLSPQVGRWQLRSLIGTGVDVIICSAVLTACRGDAWPWALRLPPGGHDYRIITQGWTRAAKVLMRKVRTLARVGICTLHCRMCGFLVAWALRSLSSSKVELSTGLFCHDSPFFWCESLDLRDPSKQAALREGP